MLTFVDGRLENAQDSWSGAPSSVLSDEIRHPDLQRLYSIWDQKRGSRRFPASHQHISAFKRERAKIEAFSFACFRSAHCLSNLVKFRIAFSFPPRFYVTKTLKFYKAYAWFLTENRYIPWRYWPKRYCNLMSVNSADRQNLLP